MKAARLGSAGHRQSQQQSKAVTRDYTKGKRGEDSPALVSRVAWVSLCSGCVQGSAFRAAMGKGVDQREAGALGAEAGVATAGGTTV